MASKACELKSFLLCNQTRVNKSQSDIIVDYVFGVEIAQLSFFFIGLCLRKRWLKLRPGYSF